MNEMKATPAQKKELTIEALLIAGFTENPDYPGMYAQINGNKKTVVDMTVGLSTYLYDRVKKQKIVTDDEDGTLAKLDIMIAEAEDGQMPSRTKADIFVNVMKPIQTL